MLNQRLRVPFLYQLAKEMERRHIRGGTRLIRILRHVGALKRPADFAVSDTLDIRIPIGRNPFDQPYLDSYESEFIASLIAEVNRLPLPAPITLIDVGADIGLFSLKLVAHCPAISRICAFEPNSEGFSWLQFNLANLPKTIAHEAYSVAIADFEGKGRLSVPDQRFYPGVESSHAQYFIEPWANGAIDVKTIDSLIAPSKGSVVLKIDVEGGELSVLRGAARLIAGMEQVVVAVEAHPAVVSRTGVDPVECLRLLASLRPFRFVASETGTVLHVNAPIFDQIPPDQVYNLIASSQ